MRLVQALQSGVLLGDGANGTGLSHRGFHEHPYDLANILAPELVLSVHEAYFEAGADFVETNTFWANSLRFAGQAVDVQELNIRGAQIARKAAGKERLVLGAMGPGGRALAPISNLTEELLMEALGEQAKALEEGGVDGFLLETYVDLEELKIAVKAVRAVSNLPIIASKAFIEDGEMLSSGFPALCADVLSELGVIAMGANCIVGPQRMLDIVREMSESATIPIMAMPAPGLPQIVKGEVVYDTAPDYFAKACARLADEGAQILGGCCGTEPEHIAKLSRELKSRPSKPATRISVKRESSTAAPMAVTEPSELKQKLGHKFVTAVEMDVPRGLNLDKFLAAVRQVKIAGADVINISDGARARLRMNPAAVSALIQNRVGIEVTMHFACRDRNILAIQADLLGWHALGIRNILCVTGDPTIIGDYPSATSVFDVDSVGLVRILSRYNDGMDLAGYSVGMKCNFTIACAYNPLAVDPETELDRLKRKVDAGATLVYTQPVFDIPVAEQAVELCKKLKIPVLVGILPLRNQRHCEFMHNEVPGVSIPERIRKAIADASSDEEALKIGIAEAQSLARAVRAGHGEGIYLMPPFGSAAIAQAVMEAANS
ncbi:MAG: bifunctional homocysteine S-methyltransferase/methylenetetrahydrofolate reductase [Armatimonadetes bacterium]|nr:bifunctional homocysteine S-methyltransferase/methylenetetrahydrofolate reductase [Armatimonadota bacterium]